MTIRYKSWALALVSLLFAFPALAAQYENEGEGPYLFVTAGAAKSNNACKSGWITTILPAAGSTAPCTETRAIYRVGLGYQYTPVWGLEINYGTFGRATSTGYANLGNPTPDSYSWQLKASGLAIQGVATVHLLDNVAVFGKFGLARVEFDEFMYSWNQNLPPTATNYYWTPVVRSNPVAPALGAGIRYDVGLHGSILLQAETWGSHQIYGIYGVTSKVTLVAASVGLMYRY